MLWLASLIGLAGAGAAALVMPQAQADEEEDTNHDDDYLRHEDELETAGDLLAFDDDQTTNEGAGPLYLHEDFLTQEAGSQPPLEGTDAEYANEGYDELFAADSDEDGSLADSEALDAAPVALGDWVLQGPPAELIEYEAETDSLMLVWDDLAEGVEEPEVRVEHDPDDTDVKHVVLNDYSVAEVHGDPDLSAEDVTVIPLSSALIVGLEPA